MYKVVAFDLGYTLVYLERETVLQEFLAEEMNIHVDIEKIKKAYHLADKDFMRSYPRVLGRPKNQYMNWYFGVLLYYLDLIGVDMNQCFYQYLSYASTHQRSQWKAYTFVKTTLTSLKKKGYRLALISNWDHTCRQVLQRNGLEEYFDEMVISSEVQIEKPKPQIFQLALNALKIKPEEMLYVGDNYYDDVVGSRAAKISSVILNPYGKTGIEEIQDVDVLSSVSELINYLEGVKI